MSASFGEETVGNVYNELEIVELSEFIKDQLYFITLSNRYGSSVGSQSLQHWKKTLNVKNVFYLNVDETLVYESFYSDFGPLNLAMVYHYISIIREKLKENKKIVHVSHKSDQKKRSNGAFLICAYMIIEHDWSAHQAYKVLSHQHQHIYLPFRDASCLLHSEFSVTVEECVNALYKAKFYGFFNFNDFDVHEYEKYETVKYGDINWIVPGTLLAFSSPHNRDYTDRSGYQIHSPAYYYDYFKENNVKHVVRLNSKRTYDARRTFIATANIQHTDMFFTDGTPPTDIILEAFLRLCEQYMDESCDSELTTNKIVRSRHVVSNQNQNDEDNGVKGTGAVAVHCKAGLGRTGCLIAAYIVKHWPFSAVEAIAWTRISRPGSVIGVQQQWLIDKQEHLKTVGKQFQEKRKRATDKYKRFTNGVYSLRRHTFKGNAYEYIDLHPQEHISSGNNKKTQPTCSTNGENEIKDSQFEEHNQNRLSSTLKKKLKTNNHVLLSGEQIELSNQRQLRSTSKNEDSEVESSFSFVDNNRRATNISLNKNNIVKKNNGLPSVVAVTRNNSKASVAGKKNTKSVSLNKANNRLTRTSTKTVTEAKITDESKPSYALATVASAARMSRRLHNQNVS